MKKAKIMVWVLKTGRPTIDRRTLCKMFNIKSGIYTANSSDAPAWIKDGLSTLEKAITWFDGEQNNGKSYTLVSFPAVLAKNPAMSLALLKFGGRLKATYWLNPAKIAALSRMLETGKALNELCRYFDANYFVLTDEINNVLQPELARQKIILMRRNQEELHEIIRFLGGGIDSVMRDAVALEN